jgi:hypothetical protein
LAMEKVGLACVACRMKSLPTHKSDQHGVCRDFVMDFEIGMQSKLFCEGMNLARAPKLSKIVRIIVRLARRDW